MTARIIPITDSRGARPSRTVQAPAAADAGAGLLDRLQRPLLDLRISVTDRCNFRCVYCMPRETFDQDYPYVPHAELLSFEEITRLARIFVRRGTARSASRGASPCCAATSSRWCTCWPACAPNSARRWTSP